MEQFFQALKLLQKECEFIASTSEEFRENYLLKSSSLSLRSAYEQVLSLDMPQKQSETYFRPRPQTTIVNSVALIATSDANNMFDKSFRFKNSTYCKATNPSGLIFDYFCHPRDGCRATILECRNCSKKGNFPKLNKSSRKATTSRSFGDVKKTTDNSIGESLVPLQSKIDKHLCQQSKVEASSEYPTMSQIPNTYPSQRSSRKSSKTTYPTEYV
ncbi:unnamed protein product [Lepeophtheirus salmonis]|uniref:(salmon louse) hypothetical protein n=1 Tax=Lepeophtheirus salmonis TaxID=72036 RepID=A0A7R8HA79_LEPSM|nr:unnamed protein product [Lepeophtheirus salmonis]CAF2968063.1 unnamed protein product [Lepeophtheirus salmonis]